MYAILLADIRFHDLLLACDRDLANTCRAEGCELCGGRLHSARYPRKPRGRACRLGPEHDLRLSFCCAVDGCRSRETPASLRFLGRRVYVAAIVVLIAILRHGATDARMARLSEVVSVDRRTVERWRPWWPRIHDHPVLAGRPRPVHAAGRSGASAGIALRSFRR